MDSDIDQALVTDIARVVIARVRPAELPTLRAMSEAYFADPERSLAGGAGGGGPLRIGDTGIVLLLTPVALAAATEVTQYLFSEAIRPGLVRGGAAVRRLFGATGGRTGPDEAPVELTDRQWAHVRQMVVDVVVRCGHDEDVAQVMADAVVGAGHRAGSPGGRISPTGTPGDRTSSIGIRASLPGDRTSSTGQPTGSPGQGAGWAEPL
ncbi:hypothetical protein OG589_07365 [Sphaerisporangium sp. NBC_01403]|uniref:hypothetical protein n=1 Tax=Sphaerisporangium sp. NBC_01403 TaxID=2903599 RepID=UPI003252F7DC